MKILIVDDDYQFARVVQRQILHVCELPSILADGVTEAHVTLLNALAPKRIPFDLVITDVDMPDGTGFELAEIARALSMRPRMMFMTGLPTMWKTIEAHKHGADLFNKLDMHDLVLFVRDLQNKRISK